MKRMLLPFLLLAAPLGAQVPARPAPKAAPVKPAPSAPALAPHALSIDSWSDFTPAISHVWDTFSDLNYSINSSLDFAPLASYVSSFSDSYTTALSDWNTAYVDL